MLSNETKAELLAIIDKLAELDKLNKSAPNPRFAHAAAAKTNRWAASRTGTR